ncbi:MAG TPA: carboxypeptidase regulatory-like domain-containing protein [Candidatus Acidoferrales bacterium]|nr:carboxypeptidase regulatory-like domain-containing protein [Candidatus Acidoferrales bacterium]
MRVRAVALALWIALTISVAGCSKKEPEESAEPPAPTAVVDPATSGSITGTVRLEGAPPEFKPIDMSAEAACMKANPRPVVPAIVVTGPHDALANAVVYVKSGLGRYRYELSQQSVALDQKGCMYDPRVLAMTVDQTLEVKNEDPTIHNVHPMPILNHAWNKSEPVGEPPIEAKFTKPELAIPIACNIHPWMRAFLFVFDNPYFAITPKTGTFELKNLPPGTYTIEAWHERFGKRDETVTLGAKGSATVAFVFSAAPSH